VKELPVFKGACTVSHRFSNLRSLLNASDAAMYEGKSSGRNRVGCYLVAKEEDGAANRKARRLNKALKPVSLESGSGMTGSE
jgi:hypothetical protein